ncbi:PREDICTED: putative acyl-activating enzyme 19 isoform X1 [Ipomoea nil]|uniref:putative acyl-activating enzyme 19 isoform X1 n=1 Tax=Ipomoea nil TaxID=35883 RepID=UPI000900B943|nr:PREDICTED: putative acyl-activating enzyme 19 isoform X1 [Ipomoea nil]XP_019187650.1 PREDICTED: putative acyl-activating enzyme 19 isoform X1 [Ipomoea nil]XP_019187658.1 PREDICTED: putative acyl-activating enzyme 19 isoform X1 [Ipomoea nil]
MTGGDASTTTEHFAAACCISHEFNRRASLNPNRIAVIHACGGARIAREFHRIHKNDSDEQTIIDFDEFISEKTTSLRPTVYEGDRCFTFSDILSAVDSLSSRLRRILDGANDSHLIKPRSGNGVLRDHLVQVENSESLESSAQQFNELQKAYTPRVIGVYMEPSIEYIITVLSVLRCGEAFMPLDPSWPKERILWVLSSSKANLLVGCGSSVDSNFHQLDKLDWLIDDGSCPIFRISMEDYIQKKVCDSSHLVWPCERERLRSFCYLMYTSGSTGEPKGVCGTEAGLLNRFLWMQELYPLQLEDLLLFKTSISFIDHLQEFLGALLATCTLVIPPFNQLKENLFYIVNILQEYLIGRIVAVPSFMRAILPALESAYFRRIQSSLKVLVLSGETFHLSLWKILVKILPQTAILNLYGSTEVSGDCTYFDCESLPLILEHKSLSGVPIGLPLQSCDVLLLGDDDPNEGEICVSGLCLSAGYFCYPSVLPLDYVELSQNHDSKSTDHRVQQYFRTGDFARKLQNGNFIFLGRKDRTVKISGHRIALEEVENVLREHPEVADAAVIFRNDKRDTSLLEAHLIMKENNEHVEILRSITNWIARKLPPAMIPVRFFFTESFPMSSSGKVDYNLLANSHVCNAGFHIEVDETQDIDLIQAIEKAFCDGLRVDKISHYADFFEMGGNSISAAYVSYTLGINMKDLYTFPTPKKLQMALLRKEISFNHDLRSGASEGVNYEGHSNSNILSLYSREPHHNRRMPLNENSFKRLKMDSNLYIESNYVSAREFSYSNLNLINCSFSRCNYVKHGEECGGNICDSVCSQEFPRDRKFSLREFWKVDMESCVDASPLVVYKESNVYVFIGSHSHKFVCIDAKSGVVQWMVKLQGRIECSAAIVGDFSQVVVGCYEGNIYFLNFSNGSTHWSYQTCGEVKSQPVVDKPRHLVWCGSHDHNLYALDYKNYCCIFKIPCGGSVFGSPAVDEMQGKLYVASTSGRVTAVSIKAQLYSVQWIKELGVPVFGSLSISFSYERVICCLVDGSVIALDASGSVVWKGRTGGPIFAGPCTSHTLPSQVLICSRDSIIYSFDLESGRVLWKHSVEDPITASAYIDENLLLSCDDHTLPRRFICVCTSSGSIHVLQVKLDYNDAAIQSGEDVIQEFAKLNLEGDIFSSPVMIGGTIFVGCRDDYVHCLKLER